MGQFYEQVARGAFGDVSKLDVTLNVQHERPRPLARTQGGGLELRDYQERLVLNANIPHHTDGNDTLTLVKSGILRGLSIEMRNVQDSWQDHIRTIHSATLAGIGLVDSPAHTDSIVEARKKAPNFVTTRLYGVLPFSQVLKCQCHRGKGDQISFDPGAFDEVLAGGQEILGIKGQYMRALSSRKKGSLRLDKVDDGIQWEMDLPPDSTVTKDLLAEMETTNILGRPIFDPEGSVFVERGGVAHYSRVKMKALLLGASDADAGWLPVSTKPIIKVVKEKEPKEKRVQVWL